MQATKTHQACAIPKSQVWSWTMCLEIAYPKFSPKQQLPEFSLMNKEREEEQKKKKSRRRRKAEEKIKNTTTADLEWPKALVQHNYKSHETKLNWIKHT